MGVQVPFVLALAAVSGRAIPIEFSRSLKAALTLWIVGLAFLVARIGVAAMRSERPAASFVAGVPGEGRTMVRALQVALVLAVVIAFNGWAKSMIPHVAGFWADPFLADLDHWLFGRDPWVLFRNPRLEPVYVFAYLSWFIVTFGTVGVLAFSRRDHSQLITFFLVALIFGGTIGQYALPSAGPIFYERIGLGDRFAELVATNHPMFNTVSDFLWRHHEIGGTDLGTGISAMPSMHVTMAVWTVFAFYRLWKPLAVPAALYALTMWAASIASGWHYATDGMVGLAIATLAYLATCRSVRTERSSRSGRAAPSRPRDGQDWSGAGVRM